MKLECKWKCKRFVQGGVKSEECKVKSGYLQMNLQEVDLGRSSLVSSALNTRTQLCQCTGEPNAPLH